MKKKVEKEEKVVELKSSVKMREREREREREDSLNL